MCPLVCGCVTYNDAPQSGVHFGIVKINKSDADSQHLQYLNLNSLGIWVQGEDVENSAGIGWRKSSRIHSPPRCQITVIINNVDEADQIIELISNVSNEKGELCVGEI